MLVDTHTHTWGADTDELPWQAEVLPPGWSGPYTHADLVADMDAAGVDRAVIVTSPIYGRGPRGNEYTMRSIEAHPDRLYGVGHADYFGDAAAVRERIRRVVGHERMLGVRMYAGFDYEAIPTTVNRDADWLLDDALAPALEELVALDACLYLLPKSDQLSQVATLAAEYPDLPIVIDHMAWPDEETSPDATPWTDFAALAEHDNARVKVSSLPRSSETGHPYTDLHEYVRRLLEWFGPERLLLGSDYPWMDDWADYGDCLGWVEECDFLSARDAAFLAHRSFEELHGV
ncbi:MAG: amidohydrolase [Haloarculaceae archaeon]